MFKNLQTYYFDQLFCLFLLIKKIKIKKFIFYNKIEALFVIIITIQYINLMQYPTLFLWH